MATTEESDLTFPEVDISRELNHGGPEEFPVDPISGDVATSKEKAEARAKAEAEAAAKRDFSSTLMSALVISGVVAAAIGVAYIVTKKLRES